MIRLLDRRPLEINLDHLGVAQTSQDPCSRMASLIGLAICIVTVFGAAGVFSSRISRATTDEALLSGDNRGFIDTSTILHDEHAIYSMHILGGAFVL